MHIPDALLPQALLSELNSLGNGFDRVHLTCHPRNRMRNGAVPAPDIKGDGTLIQREQRQPCGALRIEQPIMHVVSFREPRANCFFPRTFAGCFEQLTSLLPGDFSPVILRRMKESRDTVGDGPL